jgi:hypothetical protein
MRRGRASVERKRVLTDRRMRQKEKLGLYPHPTSASLVVSNNFAVPAPCTEHDLPRVDAEQHHITSASREVEKWEDENQSAYFQYRRPGRGTPVARILKRSKCAFPRNFRAPVFTFQTPFRHSPETKRCDHPWSAS